MPTEVYLDEEDGMPRPCVLSLDPPELLLRTSFVDLVTTLSEARQRDVCRALAIATACDLTLTS